MTVDALFVERGGPYYRLLGAAHCWDRERDALTYRGSNPVVAHPDCGPWSKLRHLYRGNGHGHGPFAVTVVRSNGGCLEQPADSLLFAHCGLPYPGELPDAFGGRSIEVEQVRWGHVARKRTWIYLVGVSRLGELPPPREPTHWCSGFRSGNGRANPENYKRTGCAVPPGIKVCSAQQRRRTPESFARWLIQLAAQAKEIEGAETAAGAEDPGEPYTYSPAAWGLAMAAERVGLGAT